MRTEYKTRVAVRITASNTTISELFNLLEVEFTCSVGGCIGNSTISSDIEGKMFFSSDGVQVCHTFKKNLESASNSAAFFSELLKRERQYKVEIISEVMRAFKHIATLTEESV